MQRVINYIGQVNVLCPPNLCLRHGQRNLDPLHKHLYVLRMAKVTGLKYWLLVRVGTSQLDEAKLFYSNCERGPHIIP